MTAYIERIVPRIHETLTFFRGRFRREVGQIYLAGGGALLPDLAEQLHCALAQSLAVLNPLVGLADSARGREEAANNGARFVTACGLCRWWDVAHV